MILDDIVNKKIVTLSKSDYVFDMDRVIEIYKNSETRNFKTALSKPGLSIIGEIKKASPSRGIIKENFNPVEIAKEYEWSVDAISILTEEHFFKGCNQYLIDVHNTVLLPILRKDFIISPLQIFESKEMGASSILLIVSILEKSKLRDFYMLAKGLKLDAIIEVHNKEELDIALEIGADIIGINNRNLIDFTEDIYNTIRLRESIPNDIVVVSESSIHTAEDIKILSSCNVNAILVGESFMKSNDIKKKAKEFRDAYGY